MFFDSVVQISSVDIEEKADHLMLVYDVAMSLPLGPGQVVPLQVGRVRFPLDRASAIEHATKMLAAAEALPEPKKESDLIVPQGLDVDKVADELAKFKG